MLARVGRVSPPTAIHIWTRSYMSVDPPLVYPRIKGPRRYGEKKTFIYNHYSRIFQQSASSPIILLQHSDFSIPRLIALRREIAAAASRHVTPTPSFASPTPAPISTTPPSPQLPKLMFLKSSIFGVVLRDQAPKDTAIAKQIADMVEGGLAILTLPELNPPQLQAVLKTMSRAVPPRKPKTPEQIELEKKELEKTFVPGRGVRRFKPDPIPDLKVVGALIEGRVFKAEGVQDVAKLPNLDTLRAQVVGLLSAPATQLAMVLSEASGGKLARTLEGLKKSLEDAQSQDASPPSS
ncbi:unnamed protein product [Somion occarium]|uniref:Ribosomal protein L10 n=1 Tax=Somion occarium TaxID=3059160 RepID=A0ABP1CG67_9APHY